MDASEILTAQGLFHGLGKEELKGISLRTEVRDYKPGETAVEEGRVSPGVFFILSGSFRVSKKATSGNRLVDLAKLTSGEFFGEMEFLDSAPVHASLTAEVASSVALIEYRQFLEIKNTNPQSFIVIILNMARTLSKRLRDRGETLL